MIHGLINGIKSMIGSVGKAVSGVADTIRSFLHFSVPDQGPLVDYESWMPDFMGGLAKGIQNSKHLVNSAIKGLSADMTMGVKYKALPIEGQGMMAKTSQEVPRANQQRPTIINFNGSYAFVDKKDIDYFMNQAAVLVQRRMS